MKGLKHVLRTLPFAFQGSFVRKASSQAYHSALKAKLKPSIVEGPFFDCREIGANFTSPSVNLDALKKRLEEAKALYHSSDVVPCEEICEEIIGNDSGSAQQQMSPQLKDMLAQAYCLHAKVNKCGNRKKAINYVERALALDPNSQEAKNLKKLLKPEYPVKWPENQTPEERKESGSTWPPKDPDNAFSP